jgi:hypothetical protein
VALAIFLFKQKQLKEQRQILYNITREIENLKDERPEQFNTLTGNIRRRMLDQQLEGKLSRFLVEQGINKPSA